MKADKEPSDQRRGNSTEVSRFLQQQKGSRRLKSFLHAVPLNNRDLFNADGTPVIVSALQRVRLMIQNMCQMS